MNNGRSVKNTPNQNKRKRNRGPKKATATRTVPRTIVRDCTRNYLQALTDPFGVWGNGTEVCIPDEWSLPSFKLHTKLRGNVECGTTGFGFITVAPFVGTNASPIISHSDSTYPANTVALNGSPGVTSVSNGQLPFATVRPFRVVGTGLRVRYIGTELNRNGLVVLQNFPAPGDTPFTMTFQELASRPGAVVHPVDRRWKSLAFRGSREAQHDWANQNLPASSAGNLSMAIAFSTLASDPGLFEYEYVSFYEFVSSNDNIVPGVTHSDSDIQGIAAIRNYLSHLVNGEASAAIYRTGVDYIYSYLTGASGAVLSSIMSKTLRLEL